MPRFAIIRALFYPQVQSSPGHCLWTVLLCCPVRTVLRNREWGWDRVKSSSLCGKGDTSQGHHDFHSTLEENKISWSLKPFQVINTHFHVLNHIKSKVWGILAWNIYVHVSTYWFTETAIRFSLFSSVFWLTVFIQHKKDTWVGAMQER